MAESIRIHKPALMPVKRWMLFLALFTLPWIDASNIATLLLLGLGVLTLMHIASLPGARRLKDNKLVWLLGLYYLGYLISFIIYPHDELVRFAVQQKAAFLGMPVLLTLLCAGNERMWHYARYGMVAGTSFALLCCLVNALLRYRVSHNADVFFYHELVSLAGANAIYTSVYVLASMAYVISYLNWRRERSFASQLPAVALLLFLLGGLFLLSSKLLLIAGIILLLYCVYRYTVSRMQKAVLLLFIIGCLIAVFATQNRINDRFSVVAWKTPEVALKYNDYSEARFDGLNLRMLLWRMGIELLNEKNAWLTGLGGKYYHHALNEKIASYKLYEGYQNYDFHNQYVDTLAGFGIGGLLLFVFTLAFIVYQAARRGNSILVMLTLIFSVSFLTESLLETQAGILVFTIIISGEWIQQQYS